MLAQAILIVLVIVLIFILARQARAKPDDVRKWDCVDRDTGRITTVEICAVQHGTGCKCPKCTNPEKESMEDNLEYFSSCGGPSKKELDCICAGDKFAYAENDFGAPGFDFKDWVASQAVEPQTIKGHAEFVKDRIKDDRNIITGPTWSPADGGHESYTYQPWQGLRRPEAVNFCNPTQVPDVRQDSFLKKPKFNWNSSV